jgi:site-specific DNA-cytosine methylase
LVKFLDEVESIEYPEEIKQIYENLTEEDMEKIEKYLAENIEKWIRITDEEFLDERKQLLENVNRMNSGDMQSFWQKTFRMDKNMKDQMEELGYYDNFVKNFKILNSDYYQYYTSRKKFIESLNLKIDDKGKIEVAD